MKEFKIIIDSPEHCQKVLNQWRHQYWVQVIQMHPTEDMSTVMMLITRQDKRGKQIK